MNKIKTEFYNSLPETDQYILNVAALKAESITAYNLPLQFAVKKPIPAKLISAVLAKACDAGLFEKSERMSDIQVSVDFLIYILPELKQYAQVWQIISEEFTFYYHANQSIKNLRNYLYSLLHNRKKIAEAEGKFLSNGFSQVRYYLIALLSDESYKEVIPLMNESIVSTLLRDHISRSILNLEQLEHTEQLAREIEISLAENNRYKLPSFTQYKYLHLGKFGDALAKSQDEMEKHFISAIEHLYKGDSKSALANFEKGLKEQRSNYRGTRLPLANHTALYYLIALLSIAPGDSSATFQKMNDSMQKKIPSGSEEVFISVIHYYYNDKKNLDSSSLFIENYIQSTNNDYQRLIGYIVLFLIDFKPDKTALPELLALVNKTWSNGYLILGYDLAYVLKRWYNDEESQAIFKKFEEKLDFQPALSNIFRQEEWEKSLNAFLTLGTGKSSDSGNDEQEKHRVVYYLGEKNLSIQPVLQTRTAKGGWSSGRNIALKTFYQGNVPSMTQQDYRVSKHVRLTAQSYGTEDYCLSKSAIKELVAHPFVFLNGTSDLSVEIIAARPVLKVTKTSKGYALSTDIKEATGTLIFEKETNTRFKVYDLTNQQISVITALNQQKIIVPEQGKEKLMQVLGNFSSHFTVHSDISVSEHTKVRKVNTDSRIRVQLLPLGDGLKAEFFAKPFGSHPPYCKPGTGGKTLIANQKGEQLQVTRNLVQETEYSNLLLENIQVIESLEINDGIISFSEPKDSLHLLDILAVHQEICVVEWPEGERFKIRGTVNFKNLNLRIKSQMHWFELQGELKVDETTVLTIQQLLQLTGKGYNRFIELKQGEFLALSEKLKKQIDELRTFSTLGKDGLLINKYASVALADFFEDAENLKTDKSWKEFRQRLDSAGQTDVQVPAGLQAELRPYQEDGFRWLTRLAEWEAGACLADDMGLGKTIQALAILLHRAKMGASLVICPVSVVHNWITESAKFAPTLNVKTLSTSNRAQILSNLEPGDLLVTTYGLLQSEEKEFSQTPFSTIVLDEAHTIKNYTTKTSKAAMQLKAPFRMVLTGTPIQNHLGEIWNLFHFINPGLLGTLEHFTDSFIKTGNAEARKQLKKLVAPFILRRTKSSVLEELPAKTEIVRKVELSAEESAFYEALRRQAVANLENDDSPQGTKHLKALAEITRLRQACCNPALVNPDLNITSTKLATFFEIVAELMENKHKALVFSQFVTHLTLVRKALDQLGINYQYLDGSCSSSEREQSVKKFQSGEGDLFLISLKAGGLGLNLTAADFVIHLDPWWNPAVEDQASDRAHRIGQIRPVTIYRLVAENTIEEKIIDLHNTKRNLAETLLEGTDQTAKLSMDELISLIRNRSGPGRPGPFRPPKNFSRFQTPSGYLNPFWRAIKKAGLMPLLVDCFIRFLQQNQSIGACFHRQPTGPGIFFILENRITFYDFFFDHTLGN